jgi:hypothetical protein
MEMLLIRAGLSRKYLGWNTQIRLERLNLECLQYLKEASCLILQGANDLSRGRLSLPERMGRSGGTCLIGSDT